MATRSICSLQSQTRRPRVPTDPDSRTPELPNSRSPDLPNYRTTELPLHARGERRTPQLSREPLRLAAVIADVLQNFSPLTLRRTRPVIADAPPLTESFGDVEIEMATRTVRRKGTPIPVTAMEFDLLVALLRRRGAVASRIQLLAEVWGHSAAVLTRTVDTHIGELRRKLEDEPANPRHILTVRKAGYRLQC